MAITPTMLLHHKIQYFKYNKSHGKLSLWASHLMHVSFYSGHVTAFVLREDTRNAVDPSILK